jgi:hypothetical protein
MPATRKRHELDRDAWRAIYDALDKKQRLAFDNLHSRLGDLSRELEYELKSSPEDMGPSPRAKRFARELHELINAIPWL